MSKTLWITAKDRERLNRYLVDLLAVDTAANHEGLQQLNEELQRAHVIADPAQAPGDVITMRSRVRLHNQSTSAKMECTLVYPEENDAARGCVSVLAPLGTALLGRRAGETIEVNLPRGRTQFAVEALLYQPEAAGEFDR
ncbi:MAG: nucleoside diphosphate kinase regulator [Candidatus Competibacteraceae bacterium]|nr:nucleoside diphosphate kinase regulator [Candidatus Competibacteraceae bacterium]